MKQRRLTLTAFLFKQWRILLVLGFLTTLLAFILQKGISPYESISPDNKRQAYYNSKFRKQNSTRSVDHGGMMSIVHSSKPIDASLNIVVRNSTPIVAIGCAVTTRHVPGLTVASATQQLPLLHTLLPSLCTTVSAGYIYKLYIAYDLDDEFLYSIVHDGTFEGLIQEVLSKYCDSHIHIQIDINFVECEYSQHPAWSQNDAMMAAYVDGADYFYRVNDDTEIVLPGWTESFISELQSLIPPNVGVVGPLANEGKSTVLTYDFVHYTHLEIFGYYYPRVFTNWWADDWITSVYAPDRSVFVKNTKVRHTAERGTRYNVDWGPASGFRAKVEQDQTVIDRYLELSSNISRTMTNTTTRRIISMSLYGDDKRYTYGAIKNVQLAKLYFPGWILRFYVERSYPGEVHLLPTVPTSVLKKLTNMGAEIVEVESVNANMGPMMWRFLVADDLSVDYFIVRDADSRLSMRDAYAVQEWITTTNASFHCIRDHPSHSTHVVSGGLWGGIPVKLQLLLGATMHDLVKGYKHEYVMDMYFLSNAIWPRVKHDAYCHDSVSCDHWTNSHHFPVSRSGTEHVGQVYDAYGEARAEDINIISNTPLNSKCDPQTYQQKQSSPNNNNNASISSSLSGLSQNIADLVFHHRDLYSRLYVLIVSVDVTLVADLTSLLTLLDIRVTTKSLCFNNKVSEQFCVTDNVNMTEGVGSFDHFQVTNDYSSFLLKQFETDAELRHVTHIVCLRLCLLCRALSELRKPVIIVASDRYEEGVESVTDWNAWNLVLQDLSGETSNIVAANNHYDVEYIRFYTGVQPMYLPNSCSHVKRTYDPKKNVFAIAPIANAKFHVWFKTQLTSALDKANFLGGAPEVEFIDNMDPLYLSQYRGIIYIPSQPYMHSMCENYQQGIPIFVPSLDCLVQWHVQDNVVSHKTLNSTKQFLHKNMVLPTSIPGPIMHFNPNDDFDADNVKFWMRFSDFYQWPEIIQYDSVEHLVYQMQSTNLRHVSHLMNEHHDKIQYDLLVKWTNILHQTTDIT